MAHEFNSRTSHRMIAQQIASVAFNIVLVLGSVTLIADKRGALHSQWLSDSAWVLSKRAVANRRDSDVIIAERARTLTATGFMCDYTRKLRAGDHVSAIWSLTGPSGISSQMLRPSKWVLRISGSQARSNVLRSVETILRESAVAAEGRTDSTRHLLLPTPVSSRALVSVTTTKRLSEYYQYC